MPLNRNLLTSKTMKLKIGDLLYGSCEGIFRSHKAVFTKRIEGLGPDWIVVRTMDKDPEVLTGISPGGLDFLEKYRIESVGFIGQLKCEI